ncbi:response regulator transcription factor [Cellvibrio sp.]|uniref:response regulator transcription factor n=1 Tax=Cellvibrio sp. TaxID=1965322 RepID=UPI003964789D
MNNTEILVVDDSRASRMLILAIIKNELPNARILEASNGDEALKLLESSKPAIAILDMNMPGITGLELATKIADISPATVRALLTANIQESTRLEAERNSVHFFKKPVSERVLKEILQLLPRG